VKITEKEWMECKDPHKMLQSLRRFSHRKRSLSVLRAIVRASLDGAYQKMRAGTEPVKPCVADVADYLRCFFGNPFRPVTFNPAWLTPTVKSLAEQIYNDRAFDRMPVLGDALEESGCTVAEVLEHCRNGGEHVRGCWVVDKVLGKE
jgi:hypothetical protein